jgi:hypothetical protein
MLPTYVTHAGEKYVSISALREKLKDDKLMEEVCHLAVIGRNKGDKPEDVVRCMVGFFILKIAEEIE